MTVGTDTYITLADAETYILAHVLSTKRTAWAALSDSDKEILLMEAAQTIDSMPLQGERLTEAQKMEFPRVKYSNVRELWPSARISYDVPDAVKYAQVEIAVDAAGGTSDRIEMQRQGVKSYSISKLSETFTGGAQSIVSHKAREFLKGWMAGSVRIC